MTGLLILLTMVVLLALALAPAHKKARSAPPHRTGLSSQLDDFRTEAELRQLAQLSRR